MDHDFRNRTTSPYDPQIPLYRTATSSSSTPPTHPMYGQPLYPRINQPSHAVTPPINRHTSYHQTPSSPPGGLGIRVVLKPEYRITPPPILSPQIGEIPRSNFQFDFDLERRILTEAEKENPNWSRVLENIPSKSPTESPRSFASSVGDPVVSKYTASGLNKDAVTVAVASYGDNPTKVREFVNGYNLLREMGFSSNNGAEALIMYDNDTEKAVAHLFNSS